LVWELKCENPIEALGSLQKDKRVIEASFFGMNIHFLLTIEEKEPAFVSQFLKGKGIEIIRLEKIVPSLEDVFVSLIREAA